jgi:hypothetical protein
MNVFIFTVSRRRMRSTLTAMSAALVAACSGSDATSPGRTGPNPPDPQTTSFLVRVDLRAGTIAVTPPGAGGADGASANRIPAPAGGASRSLIGGDAVTLTTSGLTRSAVGEFDPKKVRVRFNVAITNKLATVDLVTPTFPAPPAGVSGVLLFPMTTTPQSGVAPSVDWNGNGSAGSGSPYNFFNDPGCRGGVGGDCFRWEAFPTPIARGTMAAAQLVGFDVDPSVTSFTVTMIVAADLLDRSPPATGSITGTVTSPQRGALSGVTVSATPGSITTTTAAGTGAYSLTGLATGSTSVAVSGYPADCTNPGPQTVSVPPNAATTANFVLQCNPPLAANAGGDQDRNRSETVTLDGSASTGPVGLTYEWTQVSGPDVTGGAGKLSGVAPSFTAPSSVTTLEFDLRVSSGGTTSAPDRVVVFVLEDKAHALWVSATGNDANPGTRSAPKLTIQNAIDAAAAEALGADVYVSAGTYAAIWLASGTSLYGGYDATWLRTFATPTSLGATSTVAVDGYAVSNVTIDHVRIESKNAAAFSSLSSYGIRLASPGSGVVISNNVIVAGAGGSGSDGASGAQGSNGQTGFAGTRAMYLNTQPPGGPAGAGGGGAPGGGIGGAGGYPGSGGLTGANGGKAGFLFGGYGGVGGPGGTSGTFARAGSNAQDGSNGADGVSGAGGVASIAAVGSNFLPTAGGSGSDGANGSGGGGGGGGGGYDCYFNSCDHSGNGGGGGGGAASGGGAGQGGRGGGASLGIFILDAESPVTITGNTIQTNSGGAGGAGGTGAIGGTGGAGGPGAQEILTGSGFGGNGGAGGAGGRGGHGGGGAGGPSIGILEVGSVSSTKSTNQFQIGAGGAGGTAPLNSGQVGISAPVFP